MRMVWLVALTAAIVMPTASAERLLIDQVRETQQSSSVPIRSGRTMEQVRDKRGEPDEIAGPVGEPPITRWMYDDMIVYFEHERVIHAVVQR